MRKRPVPEPKEIRRGPVRQAMQAQARVGKRTRETAAVPDHLSQGSARSGSQSQSGRKTAARQFCWGERQTTKTDGFLRWTPQQARRALSRAIMTTRGWMARGHRLWDGWRMDSMSTFNQRGTAPRIFTQ